VLVTPPCGASSNIALWRAKIKPPVELVVGDLEKWKMGVAGFGVENRRRPFFMGKHFMGKHISVICNFTVNVIRFYQVFRFARQ